MTNKLIFGIILAVVFVLMVCIRGYYQRQALIRDKRQSLWLVNACLQNNVQLFATTHSLEAVDALIDVCSGEAIDLVAYRLEKSEEQTIAKRFNKKMDLTQKACIAVSLA